MKNKKWWFSLIEILVAIAILWILAIWFSQINYKSISDKQMGGIFSNKITSFLETVRNNALLWKWVWISWEIPLSWKIEIPFSSWRIITSYETSTWNIINNDLTFSLNKWEEISQITCKTFWSPPTSETLTSTGTVIFEKEKIRISWCSNNNFRILQIRTRYNNFWKTITINTINGVIETSTN